MRSTIHPDAGWDEHDLSIVALDGDPPRGFDCGRAEQNQYLYERAWVDQQLSISLTRMFFVKGILAAFVTTLADAVELGTREKDSGIPYRYLPAIKIAQLGVDQRFAGCGLGGLLVDYVISHARRTRSELGVRYVTLDSKPDLEAWYATRGFVRNLVVQKRRSEARPNDERLPVSMRFDLLRAP